MGKINDVNFIYKVNGETLRSEEGREIIRQDMID